MQGRQLALFDVEDGEARDYLVGTLAIHYRPQLRWRGLPTIPPGTLLDRVVSAFATGTSIPLEIPCLVTLQLLSGLLLQRDVRLRVGPDEIRPDLWVVVLAPSGAGKTYTIDQLRKALSLDQVLWQGTGIVSGAAFVRLLSEQSRGLWVRDEWLQFLTQITRPGPLMEIKDYLLRLYSYDRLERRARHEEDSLVVDSPALAILAANATDSFVDGIDPVSLIDGFAQRFLYVLAEPDPHRPWQDYPQWELDTSGWAEALKRLCDSLLPGYQSSSRAMQAYVRAFSAGVYRELPESFYRRVLRAAHKYALLYHVLQCDASPELSEQDYGWALRMIDLHLDDAARLLLRTDQGQLDRVLSSAEHLVARLRERGQRVTARELIRGVKAIRSVPQATAIAQVLGVRLDPPRS